MRQILYKIIKSIVHHGQQWLKQFDQNERIMLIRQGKAYSVVSACQVGTPVFTLKRDTLEEICPIPIYEIMGESKLKMHSPQISCYKYKEAVIRCNADYIIVGDKVVWEKTKSPVFTKNRPQDKGLLQYSKTDVVLQQPSSEIKKVTKAFHLCGVYADVWSHFMIQRAAALFSLSQFPVEILADLTLLVPEYKDEHLKQVVYDFVGKHLPNVNIQPVKDGEYICCEELYAMDSTAAMIDDESYVSYADMIISSDVAQLLKCYYTPESRPKIKPYRKLFLRRVGAYRNMVNNSEVEDYFRELGFEIIEPHLLTLEEKQSLFYEASEIVGPYSSGFSNLLYCQLGTKVLILTNLQRAFEPFLSFYAQNWKLDALFVTGCDREQYNSHSDYTIPIERIKQSYNLLLNH